MGAKLDGTRQQAYHALEEPRHTETPKEETINKSAIGINLVVHWSAELTGTGSDTDPVCRSTLLLFSTPRSEELANAWQLIRASSPLLSSTPSSHLRSTPAMPREVAKIVAAHALTSVSRQSSPSALWRRHIAALSTPRHPPRTQKRWRCWTLHIVIGHGRRRRLRASTYTSRRRGALLDLPNDDIPMSGDHEARSANRKRYRTLISILAVYGHM